MMLIPGFYTVHLIWIQIVLLNALLSVSWTGSYINYIITYMFHEIIINLKCYCQLCIIIVIIVNVSSSTIIN